MTKQREDRMEWDTPWKPGIETYDILDSHDRLILGNDASDAVLPNSATRDYIISCVNFCREFDAEFLESHKLRYLEEREASVAMASPLLQGFVGLIACVTKEGE